MSDSDDIRPGPLERAYRGAIDANEAGLDPTDRQRRRAAVLAGVAALEAGQLHQRRSTSAANRPSWLMLGGSALALVMCAGLLWQLTQRRDAEPLAGASMDGVKVAAAPPPPARSTTQAKSEVAPVLRAPPLEPAPRSPRGAARTESLAKAAQARTRELPAAAPSIPPEVAAPLAAAPADITVAQAAPPLAAPMRDLAAAPAAPAAVMRQKTESEAMAAPLGAATLQAAPEPAWLALIRRNDRNGLRSALDAGLEVDVVDALGRTPLMHAAILARPELIAELLARGASRTRVDRLGLTATQYAARSPDASVRAALADGR